MEERRTDTEETFGPQDPPAEVSDQNAEEQPAPASDGAAAREKPPAEPRRDRSGKPAGAAGEGSQSTGHPDNAG